MPSDSVEDKDTYKRRLSKDELNFVKAQNEMNNKCFFHVYMIEFTSVNKADVIWKTGAGTRSVLSTRR